MELSLCMIVKNEEEHIGRCLGSIREAVDEIIVVDTGSTDGTKDAACRFGAQVYDEVWRDDFAAARNAALDRATKPFLMWMDADDVLPEAALAGLLALKAKLTEEIDAVMMPYQCAMRPDGTPGFVFDRERIVRRGAGFRFAGIVHEAMAVHGHVIRADVPIRHLGTHDGTGSRRNLGIYERALARGEALSPRDMYYFARELMACGETTRAEQAFGTFLDMDGWVENVIDAHIQRGYCLKKMGRRHAAKEAFLRSMGRSAPRGEALCALGEMALEDGAYEAAEFWYQAAMRAKMPTGSGAFIQPDAYAYIPALQLCVCYDRMGRRKEAAAMNELALLAHPGDETALANRAYFGQQNENQEAEL